MKAIVSEASILVYKTCCSYLNTAHSGVKSALTSDINTNQHCYLCWQLWFTAGSLSPWGEVKWSVCPPVLWSGKTVCSGCLSDGLMKIDVELERASWLKFRQMFAFCLWLLGWIPASWQAMLGSLVHQNVCSTTVVWLRWGFSLQPWHFPTLIVLSGSPLLFWQWVLEMTRLKHQAVAKALKAVASESNCCDLRTLSHLYNESPQSKKHRQSDELTS